MLNDFQAFVLYIPEWPLKTGFTVFKGLNYIKCFKILKRETITINAKNTVHVFVLLTFLV